MKSNFAKISTAVFAFFASFMSLLFMFGFFCRECNLISYADNNGENALTSAKGMVVCEQTTGRVLYGKDADKKLPMASLTKIITAIVTIENNDDLDRLIEIPKEATKIEGSSIYLKEGEHLSIKDLLYGLMLRSGNDSAVALAIATSGSVEEFMKMANDFCEKLGATNTHLVTPNGLHDDNHYTTARDLGLITCYALSNPTFAEIVSTVKTTIPNELSSKGDRILKNKNKLLVQMEGATGVKTGYTKKAGRCFVGSAKRGDMQVVCVLLDCVPMFEDCYALLEKAFSEYEMVDLLEAYTHHNSIAVTNANEESVNIYSRNSFVYPLTASEKTNIHITKELPNSIKAPVEKNQEIGKLEITLGNDLIFSEKIYTMDSVEANDFKSKLDKVIEDLA